MQIIDKPKATTTMLRVACAFSKGWPKLYVVDFFPKT
jgi:hypothetical protein